MKKKVLFTHPVLEEGLVELRKLYDVIVPEKKPTRQEMLEIIPQCDALVIPVFKADREVIELGEKLKMVVPYGIGYDNVDVPACNEKGIVVANVTAVREPTAELGASIVVSTMRRVAEVNYQLRAHPDMSWGPMANLGASLRGKTLGVIGMGNIGRGVAKRLMAFGMKIIYHNRHSVGPELEGFLGGAKLVSLEELLKTSDAVFLNANLTKENFHMIDTPQLELMKKTAYIFNIGRGSLINEPALIKHLQAGKIAGAGLDVFETEPKISAELLAMENVICTAHMGTATVDDKIAMTMECGSNIINFFEHGKVPNLVNPEVMDHLRK